MSAWAWVGVIWAGVLVLSALVFGCALAASVRRDRRSDRERDRLRVVVAGPTGAHDWVALSADERDTFDRLVGMLRASDVPVVPGDGGDPQWTA